MQGLRVTVNENMVLGALVHAARVKLNAAKRGTVLNGKQTIDYESQVEATLQRVRYIVPPNMDLEEIVARALRILTTEWMWEQELTRNRLVDAVYPVKMEEPVAFPPGIYGRVDGILLLDGNPLPLEYKTRGREPGDIEKLQVWAYCIGVGFKYHVPVRQGFLQFSSPPRRVSVEFDAQQKARVLERYYECVKFLNTGETEHKPIRTCERCGYLNCKHRKGSHG